MWRSMSYDQTCVALPLPSSFPLVCVCVRILTRHAVRIAQGAKTLLLWALQLHFRSPAKVHFSPSSQNFRVKLSLSTFTKMESTKQQLEKGFLNWLRRLVFLYTCWAKIKLFSQCLQLLNNTLTFVPLKGVVAKMNMYQFSNYLLGRTFLPLILWWPR